MLNRMFFAQNISSEVSTFGYLYNWWVASSGIVLPTGWHVPTNDEWNTLGVALGGTLNGLYVSWCSHKLKTVGNTVAGTGLWFPGATGDGTNESGMSVKPSGVRDEYGVFSGRGSDANYWCSDARNDISGFYKNLNYNTQTLFTSSSVIFYKKNYGFGIRGVKDDSVNPGSVTDYDGNVYPTVKIGNQVWMAKNLRVTKYNNGTSIPNLPNNTDWYNASTGALCSYENA